MSKIYNFVMLHYFRLTVFLFSVVSEAALHAIGIKTLND